MADQQVVEYCFSAEPTWACDAIECTKTGVEFNFEKLCQLCKAGELPEKITIYLETPQFAAGEGENGTRSTGTTSGLKLTRENEGSGRPPAAAAAADTGESLLAKEIRLANDREEMLRQERLQRSTASRQQPDAATKGGKNAASATDVATSGAAPATAKPAAASPSPATATVAAGSAGVSVAASVKLFKINEFTFSPQYKNEDPVQQDVRIALQREEEIRQQRASGAAATASINREQQQSTISAVAAAAAASATSAKPPTTAPASGRSVRFANGTTLDKSTAKPEPLTTSSSVSDTFSRSTNSEQDEG